MQSGDVFDIHSQRLKKQDTFSCDYIVVHRTRWSMYGKWFPLNDCVVPSD